MKILIIHQHFNIPGIGGALRSYYLAKALCEKGHQVSVITSHKSKSDSTQQIEGIEVRYLAIPYDNRFSFYARTWAFLRFVFGVISLSSQYKTYHVTYGISAPLTVGLSTWWFKLRYRIPYIFEVGDLWPDAPIQLGFVRNWMLKRVLFWLEKAIYQRADSIVALSPMIHSAIGQKVRGKEIHFIPNMADCDFFAPENKSPDLERKFQTAGKLVVSYIGSLGVANGLKYLLDCAEASLQARMSIQFILCGDGAMLDELKRIVREKQLDNVTFVGFVNREGVKEVMNVTDAVFVCYKNVPILETGCPNKYFDGLASGKMIIINFGGWIRKEMEEQQCGFFVDPEQPADFVRRLTPLLTDLSLQTRYQRQARDLAEKKYSRKLLGESFSKLF